MTRYKATVHARVFQFALQAGTSRGVLKDKTSWFIRLEKEGRSGWGECSPIAGLSPEPLDILEEKIVTVLEQWKNDPAQILDPASTWTEELSRWPSLRFALETAWLDWQNGGCRKIFDNDFFKGKQVIPINGLVWMNTPEHMQQQIEQKLQEGYRCIKLKIGHYNWEQERHLIQLLRQRFTADQLMIRVDANGAYTGENVYPVLDDLALLEVHSIEQPVAPGQAALMAEVCRHSPVLVALDEELIGSVSLDEKTGLLEQLRPGFVVLKPSLHGGLTGCRQWIAAAEAFGAGWWMTSYLESSVGLNAIAQFTAEFDTSLYHGLGTGKIYTQNIGSPLEVKEGTLRYNVNKDWEDPA